MPGREQLLEVNHLHVLYGGVPIVQDACFTLAAGETLGMVGESGCGKSTMLRALMLLGKSGTDIHGEILFRGSNLRTLDAVALQELRGSHISIIFQNAYLSMDPVKTISSLFHETIRMHRGKTDKKQSDAEAAQLLEKLLLEEPQRILRSYPFELSGGMCQRVGIAVALINRPSLILADEPTSALDVISQAQILDELKMARDTFGTSLIVVTHNIGVVTQLADWVAVMYAGSIVEYGTKAQLLQGALHPYTQALLRARPDLDGNISEGLPGMPPDFSHMPEGCAFAARCPRAGEICHRISPGETSPGTHHRVRCHFAREKG